MTKRSMGDAAHGVLRRTGADAFAAITSDAPPTLTSADVPAAGQGESPAPRRPSVASSSPERMMHRKRGHERTSTPASVPPDRDEQHERREAERLIIANVRLAERHMEKLREIAWQRAQDRGKSRIDASEVLREILDVWMDRGGQ